MEIKNIVIDRGNSSFKCGLFYGGVLEEEFFSAEESQVVDWVEDKKPEYILFSSVAGDEGVDWKSKFPAVRIIFVDKNISLPFKNLYGTPETLGADRVAAVAGAFALFPRKNCLVIDTGTCITYDFLDFDGNYQGGGISPGLQMRFRALNQFTAKLPLVEKVDETELIGTDTRHSILSGVLHGTVAEVEGIITKYRQKHGELQVIMCGGDTKFFESKLKEHIFAVANLVLIGLNRILLYNIKDFEADI